MRSTTLLEGRMMSRVQSMQDWIDYHLPMQSARRKVAEIISLTLVIEGLFVFFLFSYVGMLVGILSFAVGSFFFALLREESPSTLPELHSPGVKAVDWIYERIGGRYAMISVGILVVASVLTYNAAFSTRPGLGDLDTLSVAFGAALMLYPVVRDRFKIESTFAIIFIGLVMILLVLPQGLTSIMKDGDSSSLGGSFVHYMLAAPFSWILGLIGIPSSASGNLVTVEFQDGSIHVLGISAYCAGLYSFSIFVSAFSAFVLVYERLSNRVMVTVLVAGFTLAYLGNLMRMVVIGVIGYYRGMESLLWAHENIGWIIFLGWSACFWWIILGWISKRTEIESA